MKRLFIVLLILSGCATTYAAGVSPVKGETAQPKHTYTSTYE